MQLWDGFGTFTNNHQSFLSFLQGFVAPALTSAVFLIFPIIMRRISAFQGTLTKSMRERNTLRKLYFFFVFNNLFVFTIFSVAWSAVSQVIELSKSSPDMSARQVFDSLDLAQQISSSIINISSFWIMYIVRSNIGAMLDLIQIWGLIVRSFAKRFLSPTPRKLIRWTAPPEFDYASHINWLLFYSTIALTFTTIQPIILVVTCFYFTIDTFLKKYTLLYVYVPKVESDGSFWKDLFNRTLFSVGLGNLAMFLVTWVQGGWKVAIGMLPLFPALIAFKVFSYYRLSRPMKYDASSAVPGMTGTMYGGDDDETVIESDHGQHSGGELLHNADLRIEFGNPALYRKLIVPMVKKEAGEFLEQILASLYAGGDEDDRLANRHSRLDGEFEIVDEEALDIVNYQNDPNFRPSDKDEASLNQSGRGSELDKHSFTSDETSTQNPFAIAQSSSAEAVSYGRFHTPTTRSTSMPTTQYGESSPDFNLSSQEQIGGDRRNPYESEDGEDMVMGISFATMPEQGGSYPHGYSVDDDEFALIEHPRR